MQAWRSTAAATIFFCTFLSISAAASDQGHTRWTRNNAPTESVVTGGKWTLEQSGAANGRKSAGYCDAAEHQINNPGTERMQPYYFPVTVGHGNHLQGYFDWRPKDIDEAVAAAVSEDAGYTWRFQQKVLELRTTCPNGAGGPDNSDNGDDDGQGHAYVIEIDRHTYLYTLIRFTGHIDHDDLVIHDLTPRRDAPLTGAPDMTDAPSSDDPNHPLPPLHTIGLTNPDGILAAIPGTWPLKVIYEQKDLNGDLGFPAEQRCETGWADYYRTHGMLTPNHDVTHLRLVETVDGIHFSDLGVLEGLTDITTTSVVGTRWVATAGTVMKFERGGYGLLFSGGNCVDADSDSFHYIGYAESNDLLHWTVINGINNPIVSIAPLRIRVNDAGLPDEGPGSHEITVPSHTPVAGDAQGWLEGRVYAPSATLFRGNDITVVFAGYHTQKPKNGLGDYRSIGRVSLHSSRALSFVGLDTRGRGSEGDEEAEQDPGSE